MRTSVILITPEASSHDNFLDYLAGLRRDGKLARVIVDKAYIYGADLSWRISLGLGMTWLRRPKGVQRVFMTGTLPQHTEDALYKEMYLGGRDTVRIRAKTTRRDLNYRVLVRNEEAQFALMGQLIQKQRQRNQKTVIYCCDYESLN